MSVLSFAEKMIKHGTAIGIFSDEIGLTGEGGLIHDSSDDTEILIDTYDHTVQFLKAGIEIPLSMFSNCRKYDDSTMLQLEHLGGLHICAPLNRVGVVGELAEGVPENAATLETLVSEEEDVGITFENKKNDFELVFDAIEESKCIYTALNGTSDSLIFREYSALLTLEIIIAWVRESLKSYYENCDMQSYMQLQKFLVEKERMSQVIDTADFWADRVQNNYAEYDDILHVSAKALATIKYYLLYGLIQDEDFDEEGYAMAHSAFADDELPDSEKWVRWFDEKFAAQENSKKRKVILCTEHGRSIDMIGKVIDDVAIVRARDLEQVIDYQKRNEPLDSLKGQRDAAHKAGADIPITEAQKKATKYREDRERRFLRFEEGHPRNDTLYVQHPYDCNTYIELESFHCGMLERKYNELICILTSLGAKEITCSVENSDSKDMRQKSHVAGGGSVGKEHIGRAEADASSDSESSKKTSLYKKLDTHLELIPDGKPELPSNLTYYPFEEGWKQLAQKALEGRVVKASVDLTYRKDYAVTGKYVKSLNAKIESMIPAYDFSASGHYESEVESELKELESTVWHYEVSFGNTATHTTNADSAHEKDESVNKESSTSSFSPQELSVLRRARRYAQTKEARKTGMLSEAQRSDLERLAAKYGVSDIDVLIDEAFS